MQAGDRVGVCVTQLDPKLVERGLACAPGSVPTFRGAVAAVEKIRFHAGAQGGGWLAVCSGCTRKDAFVLDLLIAMRQNLSWPWSIAGPARTDKAPGYIRR